MIDFERVKKMYKFGIDFTLSDIQVLLKNSKSQSFQTGDYLIKEGQLRRDVFWLRKGIVRGFRITDQGEEITTMLRWENQVVASPNLVLFDQPAAQFFQAIEPTDVFQIDYEKVQKIIEQNPRLEANRKYLLQNTLKEALERIDSFVLRTPEERYLDLIKSKPDILNRVPNKYIANVLGITPVSLSRIRKRIASNSK